jgi:hypothetical protein
LYSNLENPLSERLLSFWLGWFDLQAGLMFPALHWKQKMSRRLYRVKVWAKGVSLSSMFFVKEKV